MCIRDRGQRPIVLDGHSEIEIEFVESDNERGYIFVDGLDFAEVQTGEVLKITPADRCARLIRIKGHSHYKALHSKLGWG